MLTGPDRPEYLSKVEATPGGSLNTIQGGPTGSASGQARFHQKEQDREEVTIQARRKFKEYKGRWRGRQKEGSGIKKAHMSTKETWIPF